MFASLCILGRQPAIGLAELESLYGSEAVHPIGSNAALLDKVSSEVAFAYLGGTVKFCKILTELDSIKWTDIQKFLTQAVPQHAALLPAGKLRLGLSVYDLKVDPRQITGTGLELKKVLKKDGRAARIVPNNETALNSAQILHNQLTAELGWELIFVRNGTRTVVAQTVAVQDIEAYARRDQERPKRDARVGMLPPKLAQIIVNLATATALDPACEPNKPIDKAILDPFCGTGVVLQEAILIGYQALGTDLDPRMVEYSQVNLDWLSKYYQLQTTNYKLEAGDATTHQWKDKFDAVASEAYLGRPFTSPPGGQILQQTIADVNIITKKFLQNLATQTKPGFRLCLALPAWKKYNGFNHLPLLDHLTDMGYNRVSFVHSAREDLLYHREGQIVGRELVTLIRK